MEIKQYVATPYWVTIVDDKDNIISIEKAKIAESFEKYWWWFLKAIWVALRRADWINTEKLLSTFENYVREYLEKFILPNQK